MGEWLLRTHKNREPQPELKQAWVQAFERGLSDRFCDRIIANRDLPERLLRVLASAPVLPELVEEERQRYELLEAA